MRHTLNRRSSLVVDYCVTSFRDAFAVRLLKQNIDSKAIATPGPIFALPLGCRNGISVCTETEVSVRD